MGIIQMIAGYGVDTLVIALCTVVLTGLIKIPIKKLADRTKNSKKITRFVTFLPIIIGFGLTTLWSFLLIKKLCFERDFYIQWLSSVSLSLAIYAIWEQFVPSEKKILSKAEIEANQLLIEELKEKLTNNQITQEEETVSSESEVQIDEHSESVQASNQRKIILTNNKNK